MIKYYDRYITNLLGGQVRYPRDLKIYSRQNVTFATKIGLTYRRANDNPLIGFMEGLQFVAGEFNHGDIARVAPHAQLDLFTGQSAYGPRVGDQIFNVIHELRNDVHSRRAVIVLAKPEESLEDRPCTTSLQFRADKFGQIMSTIVTMRSSDAVWGLPYDLIQFGLMSQVIAACVGMATDNLIINIGDAHIYENTAHLAKNFELWKFRAPLTDTSDVYSTDIITHIVYSKFLIGKLSKYCLDEFDFKRIEYNG